MVYYYIYEHSIHPGSHRLRRTAGAGHRLSGHGTDVLHAHCEIDDEPMVARDVVAAMDHTTSAPRDAYVRLSMGHRFEGSGWFRFARDHVECETFNHRDGRITQRIDIDNPVSWMQCHPIVGDALLMKLYDLQQEPGKTFFDNI